MIRFENQAKSRLRRKKSAAATGRSKCRRRMPNSVIKVRASRWLLWFETMMAGPSSGNSSRRRTFNPKTIKMIGRTTTRKNK